jgi:transcriptional regulator with XRE-family HTH domain
MSREPLGQRIRRMRIERKLTQKQLASLVYTDHTTISLIETGKVTPSIGTFRMLAEAFGMQPLTLLRDVEPTKRVVALRAALNDERICSMCRHRLPLDQFLLGKDGKYTSKCKTCRRIQNARWQQQNRGRYNSYMRLYRITRAMEKQS